jgi:hypothetical protein
MKKKYKIIFPLMIVAGLLFGFQITNSPDPEKDKNAKKFSELKYIDVLNSILETQSYFTSNAELYIKVEDTSLIVDCYLNGYFDKRNN